MTTLSTTLKAWYLSAVQLARDREVSPAVRSFAVGLHIEAHTHARAHKRFQNVVTASVLKKNCRFGMVLTSHSRYPPSKQRIDA